MIEKENFRGDNVSYILQFQDEIVRNPSSTSSDEDMLVPSPGSPHSNCHGANGTIPKTITQLTDAPTSLVLKAGTSSKSSILISKGVNEREFEFTNDIKKLKLTGDQSGNSHGETDSSFVPENHCSMANNAPCSSSYFQLEKDCSASENLKSDRCERNYDDFIFPLTEKLSSPVRIQSDPELGRGVHDLLNYPLKKIRSAEDAELEQNSIEIDCNRINNQIINSTQEIMNADDIDDSHSKNINETSNLNQGELLCY